MDKRDFYALFTGKATFLCSLIFMITTVACKNNNNEKEAKTTSALVHLITLAPGHFHAALLQKYMYNDVDSTVYVFAPEGPELQSHLALIDGYNKRKEKPTAWKEKVYTGKDYMEQLVKTRPGNVVVIAGNNQMKTDY